MRINRLSICMLALVACLSVIEWPLAAAEAAFFGGPIEPDPSLDLPENPTVPQLIAAGKTELDRLRASDQTLDANQQLKDYLSSLTAKLLAVSDTKPPYPIEIHISTRPRVNAFNGPGGQIVFYNDIILEADNEAQLVAILGHELSHAIHNDYAFFWHAAKAGEDSYGTNGLLNQSQAIEARADSDATHMMYAAGWDPSEQLVIMTRIAKELQRERGGHRIFYSTHPEDHTRLQLIEGVINSLPPKPGLIKDSAQFDEIKKSL